MGDFGAVGSEETNVLNNKHLGFPGAGDLRIFAATASEVKRRDGEVGECMTENVVAVLMGPLVSQPKMFGGDGGVSRLVGGSR